MPGKKKGKKAGKKKSGKSKSKSKSKEVGSAKDPMAPEYVPRPPWPGEQLMKLLSTHEVHEKELFGMKISTSALEKLTPPEIRDLHVVFEAFDNQSRECIGPVEVRRAMKVLGFKCTRDQARKMVQDASVEGRGVVNFNEFLDLVIDQQGDSKDVYDEMMQGFKMFDYDKAEKISMENLKQACKEAGVKFNKMELQDMMEEADLDGDGYVDKDEFVKIMLQTNLF